MKTTIWKRFMVLASLSWLVLVICCYAYVVVRTVASPPNRSAFDLPLIAGWLTLGAVLIAVVVSGKGRLLLNLVFGLLGFAAIIILLAGGNLWGILAFMWLLSVAWALGGRILRLLVGKQADLHLRSAVVAVGLGFGCYSLLMLVLAVIGLLYNWLAVGLLIVLTIALGRDLVAGGKELARQLQRLPQGLGLGAAARDRTYLLAVTIVAAAVCLTALVGSLAPEIHYDALNYHLSVPKTYVDNHRVVDLSYISHSNFAHNVEMDFAFGLLLGGQRTAKLFHFTFGVLTALAIFVFCRDLFSPTIGVLAAVLFYTTPLVVWESTLAYVDLAVTFYFFAATDAAVQWWRGGDDGWLIVSGSMAGFAVAAKLNGLLAVVPLGVSLVFIGLARYRHDVPKLAAQLLKFGVAALLSAGPWFGFTYRLTGNPIFPFYNAVFRSPLWPQTNTFLNFAEYGMSRDLATLILLPWTMTFHSVAFTEANSNGLLGPVLLLPLCLIFLVQRIHKEIWLLAFLAAGSMVLWGMIVQFLRYILLAWPLICVIAAYAVARLADELASTGHRSSLLGGTVQALLLVMLIVERPIDVVNAWDIPERIPYKVALGLESRENYLSRILPVHDALTFVNQGHGANGVRILSVGSEFRLYSDAPLEGTWTSTRLWGLESTLEDEQLINLIRRWGFTHLLVDWNTVLAIAQLAEHPVLGESFFSAYTRLEYVAHKVSVSRFLSDTEVARRAFYLPVVDELLQNPGFEDGQGDVPSSWRGHGSPRFDVSGKHSHSGRGAVQVGERGHLTQAVPVRQNEIFVLSEYIKAGPDGQSARLEVNWLDSHGSFLATDIGVVPVSTEWQEHHMPVMAPPGAEVAVIYVMAHDPGEVWFDDLSFKAELSATESLNGWPPVAMP
jgi:hypothetical protein